MPAWNSTTTVTATARRPWMSRRKRGPSAPAAPGRAGASADEPIIG